MKTFIILLMIVIVWYIINAIVLFTLDKKYAGRLVEWVDAAGDFSCVVVMLLPLLVPIIAILNGDKKWK